MFDGSPESQFLMYPEPQRRVIYGFQRSHACVRVLNVEDSTDVIIEVLDNFRAQRVLDTARVNERGDIWRAK